jgi:alpha-ketoglutarate-dependent taurine dioxygenase
VIRKFDEYILAKEAINIRLNEGETLFINNNRMLHGRDAINAGSKRFLKRVWIKRD